MEYLIGFIIGILASILLIVVLIFLRGVIESHAGVIQKQIELKGPRPKGFIIEPPSEVDEVREDIINKNKEKGLDTPIQDLR